MARLFVAVWPPPKVLDELERLDRPEAPGLRWTSRDQWHVTLRFLGDADPDEAVRALSTLSAPVARAEIGPAVARLGPKVLVAPVTGLDVLARAVRTATAGIGDPPDPRPFSGHITLARRRRRDVAGLVGAPVRGAFTVDEVALVASDTHPDGARYHDLARAPLLAN